VKRKIILAIAGLLALILLVLAAFQPTGQAILFGWFAFIRRNFPQATAEPAALATGALFLFLLIAVIEVFARSLLRSIPQESTAAPRRWRFRWTLSIVSALFLMFAVGYSTIGLARHIGWMVNSNEPYYQETINWKSAEENDRP
jgi:hypothetical protein